MYTLHSTCTGSECFRPLAVRFWILRMIQLILAIFLEFLCYIHCIWLITTKLAFQSQQTFLYKTKDGKMNVCVCSGEVWSAFPSMEELDLQARAVQPMKSMRDYLQIGQDIGQMWENLSALAQPVQVETPTPRQCVRVPDTGEGRNHIVAVDILWLLPITVNTNSYVLVASGYFTRLTEGLSSLLEHNFMRYITNVHTQTTSNSYI